MSYDYWKTTEPDEPEEWAACEACGVHKPWEHMFLRTTGGHFPTEVWACDECCGIEEEEDGGPLLTQAELQERTREMLAPCTDLARGRGCTCFMSHVHPGDTDPPEPVVVARVRSNIVRPTSAPSDLTPLWLWPRRTAAPWHGGGPPGPVGRAAGAVHPGDTDPPEPVVNRNCPLHGTPMDEDAGRD